VSKSIEANLALIIVAETIVVKIVIKIIKKKKKKKTKSIAKSKNMQNCGKIASKSHKIVKLQNSEITQF